MPAPASEPRHILVLLPNWLGDTAMATPALRALRRRFPQAHITAAGKQALCELLAGFPHVDTLHALSPRTSYLQMRAEARALAPEAADLCLILPHSLRAALFAWLTGARRRVGYDRGQRRCLLTEPVPCRLEHGVPVPQYTALEYLGLAEAVGADTDDEGLELAVSATALNIMRERLAGDGPLVALAPGAAFGPSKCWLPERYAAVAGRLHDELGARCVLLTGPGEEATRDLMLRSARVPLLDPYGGQGSIEDLKAAIAASDLLIGNDSGPRHVAIAFGKPVICVMGPTSPLYTASPWERGEVLRVDVDCGPCQRPVCRTDHRCMTRISVERVAGAAVRQLQHAPATVPAAATE